MRLLAASILLSALILSYAVTMPFRDCVSGYMSLATSSDAKTQGAAAMTCKKLDEVEC